MYMYPHWISKGYRDVVNIFLYKGPSIQPNSVRARFLVDNFVVLSSAVFQPISLVHGITDLINIITNHLAPSVNKNVDTKFSEHDVFQE